MEKKKKKKKKNSNRSLKKKGLQIYLSSIKAEVSIKFLKKNFVFGQKSACMWKS